MSGSANVRSADAIEVFRIALAKYGVRTENTIEELASNLRRAAEWLEHDCPSYWKKQTKLAEDAVHEAKLNLERCLMFPAAGERPACREERVALKKAQTRLDHCREKRERVQHWKRQFQRERFEFDARFGALKRLLQIDLPVAEAKLQKIRRRLDEYQIERPLNAKEFASFASQQSPETGKDSSCDNGA